MLTAIIALFAVAAVLGVVMIVRVFKGALPPWPVAALHGPFAAIGLAILLYVVFVSPASSPIILMVAAVLLTIAALGGFVLVSFHLRKKVPPRALAGVHALVAVAGFLCLVAAAFGPA